MQSIPSKDGVHGQQRFSSGNSEFNELMFVIQRALANVNTATLVRVEAVYTLGRTSPVGTVDVTPLVNQLDGVGQPVPHGTVYGLPYLRVQGGANAFICDPKVGDIGVVVVCDEDISAVKASMSQANPGSYRTFSIADGIYLGGWSKHITPQRYVVVDDDGIRVEADSQDLDMHAGDVSISSESMTEDVSGEVSRTSNSLSETIQSVVRRYSSVDEIISGSHQVTVGEFTIIGNLHVTGIVHCTWEGNNIAVGFGGTGADLSETGGPGKVVCQETKGGPFTVKNINELPISLRYTNYDEMEAPVGGIEEGSTFFNKTISEMFDALLYGQTQAGAVRAESSDDFSAGYFVSLYDDAGTLKIKLASNTNTTAPAHGYILSDVLTGDTALVFSSGVNRKVPLGTFTEADAGKPVFLGTGGLPTLTPPASAGNYCQQIGCVSVVGSTVGIAFSLQAGFVRG